MEDSEIVELYWKRDEQAIRETEKKYAVYLKRIAANVLYDFEDCKECVNDTYLAAWNSMPEHRPGVLSTYLGKLVRQISIDRFRKNTSKKRHSSEYELSISEMEDCVTAGNSPEEELDVKLLSEAINRFIHTLKAEERHIFIGRYYYFDSVKKIAGYCKSSEAKVKTTLYRLRQKLKDYLVKEGFDL